MSLSHKKIVYMGTPDFAVEPLRRLIDGGYEVVGVVTTPDREAGRGRNISMSAVKKYAVEARLLVLQPESLKDDTFLASLRNLSPDIIVVVAFRMLPRVVWSMPPCGTFNLHASLLPDYRGAAPINRSLMNGDTVTGVTTFMLDAKIDTGEVILQRKVDIEPDDCAGTLHDKLMCAGADLVVETVDMIEQGRLVTRKQSEASDPMRKEAPKIFKETCMIDWSATARQIHNHVRGLSPYPGAWSPLGDIAGKGNTFKIFVTRPIEKKHDYPCGTLLSNMKDSLWVAVSDGFIAIEQLQLSGKRRVTVAEYIRGAHLQGKVIVTDEI
ncbi:MAG: methionyl-tRNA formyltransferase [Rikenellaceae bacterium]|nr:methionyl-tRNA formyltransferase [Rikenellaceae bacterium]MDE7356147.1 methionyl-tRNA formyltransferase [Rikenellaceae bacterium]